MPVAQYHRWVNGEALLGKCLLGLLCDGTDPAASTVRLAELQEEMDDISDDDDEDDAQMDAGGEDAGQDEAEDSDGFGDLLD